MVERRNSKEWVEHLAKNRLMRKQEEREGALERALSKAREQSSESLETAVALLDEGDRSWSHITGRVRSWDDEDLKDEGRFRFHESRDQLDLVKHQDDEEADNDEDEEDLLDAVGEVESEYSFWATSSPWQLRIEAIEGASTEGTAKGSVPGRYALVCHRTTWWRREGDEVETDAMMPDMVISAGEAEWAAYGDEIVSRNRDYEWQTPGVENLDLLLRPAPLIRGFDFSGATETTFAGRRAFQLQAVPTESFDDFVWAVAALVVLGADRYQITVDADCGVVLAWSAYIDERVASYQALSNVRVDELIDPALFSPLTGA